MMKSLIIDIKLNNIQEMPSADIRLNPNDSLSFIRGGVFFTSALIMPNSKALVLQKEHYQRLEKSHQILFERERLPFSYHQFLTYIEQLSHLNKGHQKPYKVMIFALSSNRNQGGYNSGLQGEITQLLCLAEAIKPKPDWVYEQGVNLLTIPYEREFAQAKPTAYLAGIKAMHHLHAINHLFQEKLQQGLQNTVERYQSLSHEEQLNLRVKLNEKDPLDGPEILHEALYLDNEDHILEGPSFSVFALSKNGEILIVPPKEGILKSISIEMIKQVASMLNMPVIEQKMTLETFMAQPLSFIISATRLKFDDNSVQLQRIASINGISIKNNTEKTTGITQKISQHLAQLMGAY